MTSKKHRAFHRTLADKWRDTEIYQCEARLPGCTGGLYLTPAHSRKRRFIETAEQYAEIAWLCTNCHLKAERMPHEEMEKFICGLIEARTDYSLT